MLCEQKAAAIGEWYVKLFSTSGKIKQRLLRTDLGGRTERHIDGH